MSKDELFKQLKGRKGSFVFDEKTAQVFDDMLTRSVPFYMEMQRMIVELARCYVTKRSHVYDIGCSTGATLLNCAKNMDDKGITLIGVDRSQAMLKKAEEKLKKNGVLGRCQLINADISQDFEVMNASVVIMNLVLQFVNPSQRPGVIAQIFKGLKTGGCLILVEKILSDNKAFDRNFIEFYHAFKMRNNYTKIEIERKKKAMENVLIPFRYKENIKLLTDSGFESVDSFFRWYNFCGIIAIKS